MKISTHNDWAPLKEVIVGCADGARMPTHDFSTMISCCDEDIKERYPQWLIDEANEDIEELVKKADQLLYKAKESGRNCIRF